MRKWENKKNRTFFFVLFFQHRPRFDIMPDIGKIATLPNKNRPRVDIVRDIRYIYNHKPPKMSRKKTTSHPAEPAPDPAPPRRFLPCGRATQIRPKSTAETPPKTAAKTTPKTTPETARNHPRKHPARIPPDIRQTITRHHPKTRPAFCWVRAGSTPGPDWVRAPFFGNSTTYRYTFTITATPSNLAETRRNATCGPSKTPQDPARTQHWTHRQTPYFIGCPSRPYSFYIKDL